ncbi:hypothetical protein MnTg03_01270 [bacterium MnTg03]|nr:hypothetical protein MnTg03_01270 [bacterium MnTg03]
MNNITNFRYRQQGASFVGWMAMVAIFGFLLLSFFKVFPIYNEYFAIQSVLQGLTKDEKIDFKSKRAIWESLQKRLYVNEVRSIKAENLTIQRKDGKTTITISYRTQRPYIGNLFIGGNFTESVVINR